MFFASSIGLTTNAPPWPLPTYRQQQVLTECNTLTLAQSFAVLTVVALVIKQGEGITCIISILPDALTLTVRRMRWKIVEESCRFRMIDLTGRSILLRMNLL